MTTGKKLSAGAACHHGTPFFPAGDARNLFLDVAEAWEKPR